MNVLNHAIAPEFENILSKVESDSSIRAAILISGKPDNFIAGADIKMLVCCPLMQPLCWRKATGTQVQLLSCAEQVRD